MNFDEQIARIAAKLARAKLTLGPRLDISEVEAFEHRHHVRLPEAYRQFLTRIGNRGAGPYGLEGLERWNLHMVDDVDCFSAPCILEPEMHDPEIYAEFLKKGTFLRPFVNGEGVTDEENCLGCGMVTVSHCGCNYFCALVVSGPYAGRIVYFCAEERVEPYFSEDLDFLSWYERWLDERAAGYNLEYFGWGPTGDEQALLRAYPKLPKMVFLRAITRCRRLSAEGLKVLWDSVRNPDPIREKALYALYKLNVLAAPEHITLLEAIELSDGSLWAKCILNRSRSLDRRVEAQLVKVLERVRAGVRRLYRRGSVRDE